MAEGIGDTSHVVIVYFTIRDGKEVAFLERVRQQARDSLALEPGCMVFDICVDPAAPREVVLYEVYMEPNAFSQHLASDHFGAFDAEVADWVTQKRVVQFSRLAP